MSKRRLRPDELELWQQVARSTDPMHPNRKTQAAEKAPKLPPKPENASPRLKPFDVGMKAAPGSQTWQPPKTTADHLANAPVSMDSKVFGRLKRGKLVPEARIDLHGMTLDQAHPALVKFVMTSHARGLRLVLVITGKGDREDPYAVAPRPRGVLKRQVPLWLKQAPIASSVLQLSEAHIKHGGQGAYYVYLRRRR